MLENVEVVLRPCDQAGREREGGKEGEREGMAEKGKRPRLIFRWEGWEKSRRGKPTTPLDCPGWR